MTRERLIEIIDDHVTGHRISESRTRPAEIVLSGVEEAADCIVKELSYAETVLD